MAAHLTLGSHSKKGSKNVQLIVENSSDTPWLAKAMAAGQCKAWVYS